VQAPCAAFVSHDIPDIHQDIRIRPVSCYYLDRRVSLLQATPRTLSCTEQATRDRQRCEITSRDLPPARHNTPQVRQTFEHSSFGLFVCSLTRNQAKCAPSVEAGPGKGEGGKDRRLYPLRSSKDVSSQRIVCPEADHARFQLTCRRTGFAFLNPSKERAGR
jgi:hypothetical protein